MNAGIAAYVILTQNTDVTDIVGVKVFPEVAEQETATPFIVYQLQSVAPEDTHDGPSKLDEVRFEFLCYADTYALAADLGDKVRGALDRVSGTYNGVNVESVQFNDVDIDTIDAPRRFAQVLTFTFRIKRDDFTIAQGTPVTGAKIGDLYDVDVSGVTDGQVLAYDASVQEWQPADDAGGVTELGQLTDVDINSPVQGSVISYNSGAQEFRVNNGLQELLERFKASGTGAQIYDTLNDTTKGYIDILASSATMKVNHSGMTISEASPGVISFLVAAGTDGNEVEFEAMTIEGSDAFSTVADIIFKQGALTYWENATGKIWLRAPNAGNITVLLPSSGGTLALTTDIPSVPVDSVNGQTGVVVLDTGDIDENGNLYFTDARVAANSAVAANTAKVGVIAGGTTGQALVKASGTDYDTEWADIAIDTQYHDRFQTDAETFRSGATATVELYYTAKADGDGLAESASSDTPGTDKIIRRKIYYSEAAFADPDTGTWVEFTPAPADNASFATVKAALLEYLKARTGGTVPISLKQTWEEVNVSNFLLDSYTGATGAYSLRQLSSTATNAIRVRRASDNTEQDIGFTNGELDTSALATFASGTDAFIRTWYSQTGSNDGTNTATGNQPKIYDSVTGVLVDGNSKPIAEFTSSMEMDIPSAAASSTMFAFSVFKTNDLTTEQGVYNFNGIGSISLNRNANGVICMRSGNVGASGTTATPHLVAANHGTAIFIDGAQATTSVSGRQSNNNSIGRVGSFQLNGFVQELILYASGTSDDADIQTNMNDFYQVY